MSQPFFLFCMASSRVASVNFFRIYIVIQKVVSMPSGMFPDGMYLQGKDRKPKQ